MIDIPNLFKFESIENLIFKNCEYDEASGKIKINTENIGKYESSIEAPIDNFEQKKVNISESKFKINYIVKENSENKNIENKQDELNVNNPKTGTSVIYIYIVLIIFTLIFCILNLKTKHIYNKKY